MSKYGYNTDYHLKKTNRLPKKSRPQVDDLSYTIKRGKGQCQCGKGKKVKKYVYTNVVPMDEALRKKLLGGMRGGSLLPMKKDLGLHGKTIYKKLGILK